jgi:septum site-determining protein MinC
MSARVPEGTANTSLFEIKGGTIHVPILKLYSEDLGAVSQRLSDKILQAPDFFRNAPIVIDLHDFPVAAGEAPDFLGLSQVLREHGLVPVGVRGGDAAMHACAQRAELAVLADTRPEPAVPAPKPAVKPVVSVRSEPPVPDPVMTKFVDHPVRSGQRIYAPGGDLVVLAQVSAGAELMADGNIHIYGSLRGRALAGVQGNVNSRIFCMDLQAELIAIGGHYKVSENLDDSVRGHPVQIHLKDNNLIIQDL